MKERKQIHAFVCDEGHVHIQMVEEKVGFAMDVEDWLELVEDVTEEVTRYLDEQTIGMCKGNA